MKTLTLSLVAAAVLWPATLLAAPPELKLTPDKPTPKAGELVKVAAETTAKAIKWKVLGDCQSVQDSSGRSIVVVIRAGKVNVIAVAASESGELSEFAEVTFDAATPDPVKPPSPPTPPGPTPRPGVKLKTVVVYESADASTAGGDYFASKELAARWKEKSHLPPTLADKDVKDPETGTTPVKLKPYIDRAKGKTLPQLYLVDSTTGDVLYEGPLPTTPAAMIDLLTKIGG